MLQLRLSRSAWSINGLVSLVRFHDAFRITVRNLELTGNFFHNRTSADSCDQFLLPCLVNPDVVVLLFILLRHAWERGDFLF